MGMEMGMRGCGADVGRECDAKDTCSLKPDWADG